MSRSTKLTSSLQDAIAEHIRQGHTFGVACRLERVCEATGRGWLARGRGTSNRKATEPYTSFAEAIDLASAEAERDCIEGILEIGLKGWVTKTVKVTERDGTRIKETTTTRVRNFRALTWIAERYWPHKYGAYRMPEQEAAKILMEANWVPESFAQAAVEVGEMVESHMQDSYARTNGNGNTVNTGAGGFVPPPDPMTALDALVYAGWIPRRIRQQIIQTPGSDRAAAALRIISEFMDEVTGDDEVTDDSQN